MQQLKAMKDMIEAEMMQWETSTSDENEQHNLVQLWGHRWEEAVGAMQTGDFEELVQPMFAGKRRRVETVEPLESDGPEIAKMITVFKTIWTHAHWVELLSHEDVSLEHLESMKRLMRAQGGTIDERTARLLTCIPVVNQMLQLNERYSDVLSFFRRKIAESFRLAFSDADGNASVNLFVSCVDQCLGAKRNAMAA
jgi:hypothetical protein